MHETVPSANDSTPQQQPKPVPSYEELVSSAWLVAKNGMPTRMRLHAGRAAAEETSRYQGSPDDLARRIAQSFMNAYGPSWECVVAHGVRSMEPLVGWTICSKEKVTEQHRTGFLYVHLVVGQWPVVLWRRSGGYDEGEGDDDEGEEYDESA